MIFSPAVWGLPQQAQALRRLLFYQRFLQANLGFFAMHTMPSKFIPAVPLQKLNGRIQ